MRRSAAILLIGAIASAAWTGTSAGKPSAGAACQPGVREIAGVRVRVYCGPARATLAIGGRPIAVRNGSCTRNEKLLVVNVGTIALYRPSPRFTFFGLSILARRDGTYRKGALRYQYKGTDTQVFPVTVTLRDKRRRGTFFGRLPRNGPRVAGSFSCVPRP